VSTDRKNYDGKIRVELVPPQLLEQAGCAMTYGVAKHGEPWTWMHGERGMYVGALLRHVGKYWLSILRGGDGRDPETGLSHLSGAAASLSILCWFEDRDGNLPTTWKDPPPRDLPKLDSTETARE
jgi:hypothetical protein